MRSYIDIVKDGDVNEFKELLDSGFDPISKNSYAMGMASKYGHTEIVKLLLQHDRVNPNAWNNYAIRVGSSNGHLEVVKLLLDDNRVDPGSENNSAIILASLNGHTEVIKLLLQDRRIKLNRYEYLIYNKLCDTI